MNWQLSHLNFSNFELFESLRASYFERRRPQVLATQQIDILKNRNISYISKILQYSREDDINCNNVIPLRNYMQISKYIYLCEINIGKPRGLITDNELRSHM